MPMKGPLTDADLEEINAKLGELDGVDSEIQRALRAGIPVEEQKREAHETRVKLMKIKQAYFPGR